LLRDADVRNHRIGSAQGPLFQPFRHGPVTLRNRIVMAPMTRCFSPGGVPGPEVADYYRRRAEGGVGLIVTEGTFIPHDGAANENNVPRFYGEDALAGWVEVVNQVHAAGARIMPQLWHVGLIIKAQLEGIYASGAKLEARQVGPSGLAGGMGIALEKMASPMLQDQIDAVVDAYGMAAASAHRLGFDGVELHGAHGYLIDQFFWDRTNHRTDRYGGPIANRARFGAEIVREIRRRTDPHFPIVMRISQWKQHDYNARMLHSPAELAALLEPLVDAGVDLFHCSQRRFWEPEFEGSDLNLAGWTKRLSGKPTITVGSVGLETEVVATTFGATSKTARIERLIEMLARNDFDLVAVGRALIVDHDWPEKVRHDRWDQLHPYSAEVLKSLA
jgi:2,4-dienoyl-CoA reductase-like NADH-dependent reductase (Old Yellow Enzyme family)